MKYTGCFSRVEAEAFIPPLRSILICIHDPDSHYPQINGISKGYRLVSYQQFWDLDKPISELAPASEEQIKRIYVDIKKHWDYNIFASCEAGISRSAAIREFLLRRGWTLLNSTQELRGVHPNMHILAGLERLDREQK
jgi:predicted protein tyrosine phosphatase